MREEPTLRIPIGLLMLLLTLGVYGLIVAAVLGPIIDTWHIVPKTVAYLVLGTIWLLPLRRFLIWMETGRWSAPPADEVRN